MAGEFGRLDILWEDPYGIAVNKPAGMLTQAPRLDCGEVTLEALVRRRLRPDDPASVYLGTVHRLDRPVSGVILWAKTPKATHRWANQFAGRQARKTYRAIVEGAMDRHVGVTEVWDDNLSPPDRSGQARVVAAGTPGALPAITRVEWGDPVSPSTGGRYRRLKLFPTTGRTHQLRAQAAARGWPIVGDLTYGAESRFEMGIALHAFGLEVTHPIRLDPMELVAPLPATWDQWLGR